MRLVKRLLLFLIFVGLILVGVPWLLEHNQIVTPYHLSSLIPPTRLERPYGMAPAAFDGFKRACFRAHVQPRRIGQTIGDNPNSVGYHHRDGTLKYKGQKLDYCAAVDIGTQDLTRAQINKLLEALASQGFAAFYREKGHWEGNEHIHAIYAPLKMKPQLRAQLREWAGKRRRNKKRVYNWQKRLGWD